LKRRGCGKLFRHWRPERHPSGGLSGGLMIEFAKISISVAAC